MTRKFIYFVMLAAFSMLTACSDSASDQPTPPNVTLSNLSLKWDTSTSPPDILGWVNGTAVNSGETAAQTVQIQLQLFDENQNLLSTSQWQTIFNNLNGGASLGFNVFWWFPYPSTACYKAKYYKVNVQWANNAVECESGFEPVLGN